MPIDSTSVPASRSTARWVVLLSTLGFWIAVISLLVYSPSLIIDLVGVLAIFVLYVGLLFGCALLSDARLGRGQATGGQLPPQPTARQVPVGLGV